MEVLGGVGTLGLFGEGKAQDDSPQGEGIEQNAAFDAPFAPFPAGAVSL